MKVIQARTCSATSNNLLENPSSALRAPSPHAWGEGNNEGSYLEEVKRLKVGVLLLLSLLGSACSSYYASNTERSYLQSRNGVNLEVPPPLTTVNMSHFYDLPPQDQNAKVSIRPPKV